MQDAADHASDFALEAVAELIDEEEYEHALDRLYALQTDNWDLEHLGFIRGLELVCLYAMEREAEAGARLEGLLKHTENPQVALSAGIACSEFGEVDAAEAIFTSLVERMPEDALPALNLGWLLADDYRKGEALDWFDRAIAIDPHLAVAHLQRARLLQDMGRLEASRDAFRRYLALAPDDAHEWVSLGIVESDLGEYDKAFAAYDEALAQDPESLAAHFNAAVTAARAGQRDRLEHEARTLHALQSEELPWYALLATAFLAELDGDYRGAWDRAFDAYDHMLMTMDVQENPAPVTGVLNTLLRLAHRGHLDEEKDALIARALELGLFHAPILDALRFDAGKLSDSARFIYVMLEARVDDPALLAECREDDDTTDGDYGYFCPYRVWAHDIEEAEAMAMEFEAKHGPGVDLRVVEASEIEGPSREYRGVASRGAMHIFPLFDFDEEEEEDDEDL